MQILLISVNREKKPYPVAPLGLAYVAAPLVKENHNVEILDLCFVDNIHSSLQNTLKRFQPDVIGLSIRNIDNLTYPESVCYIDEIKNIIHLLKNFTKVPFILGGSGFSLFPQEVLRYLGIETGIVGDGEKAFLELVNSLMRNEDIYGTPNLAYIKDGSFYQNPVIHSQDFSPPARDLLDNNKYLNLGGMANIETKRGCPFKCIYCTYPFLHGSQVRCRDPEDVVNEIEEMAERYKIDYVFFVDDIFNFPLDHASGICEEMKKRSLQIKWTCFATPVGVNPDLLKLMKEAGCEGIEFGTDTASPKTLDSIGKPFSVKEIMKVSELCDKIGIQSAHYLILGGPGETLDTLQETIDFIETISPKAVIAMTGLRIYPNTRLRDISIQEGVITENENLMKPHFYISPQVGEKELLSKIGEYAASQENWVVPGLGIRCSSEVFDVLRRFGKRGPLWNMLGKGKSYEREK